MKQKSLFNQPLDVINIGLSSFRENIEKTGAKAIQVDFRPPGNVDPKHLAVLKKNAEKISKANEKALALVQQGKPFLTGMGKAIDLIPGMTKKTFLHAGPPLTWDKMCGPMKGAMIGAIMYEGLADSKEAAEKLAKSGELTFAPCHEHDAVGPMAGVTSASMPVFVIENEAFGNKAYCTQNEGLGKVLRYGAFSKEVIDRLQWMEKDLYPTLSAAIKQAGKIDMKAIVAQALHMGDEVHNRNRAGTSLFIRAIAPALFRSAKDKEVAAKVLEFINSNDHFFLNLCMAASKATLDAARDVKDSSMLVVMARNGTEFGIQLSGMGRQWFTGPSLVPDALFFPGFSKADANPDIGDSAITETNGLGGFAIAASPAIVKFVGGSASDALNYTLEMYEICVGENDMYQIPALDFRGTPTGIDAVKVVSKGILPFIDTGVAHKDAGVGQVGAGVVNAPALPFEKAVAAFASTLK